MLSQDRYTHTHTLETILNAHTHNLIEYHHFAIEDNDWIRLFLFERYPHFDLIGLDSILTVLFFLVDCLFGGMFRVRHFVHSFDLFLFSSSENVINWAYDGGIEETVETARDVLVCIA